MKSELFVDKAEIGSMTAKGGFLNESDVCDKFLNYKNDANAKQWLSIMGYEPNVIQKITAIQIPTRISKDRAIELGVKEDKYEATMRYKKADVQIRVEIVVDDVIHIENVSLKKANKSAAYNQVDKRPVSAYKTIWNYDDEIEYWLKLFTGEILPEKESSMDSSTLKDSRRLFFTEMPDKIVKKIITFFEQNKTLVINDILRGRGGLCASWFLVTRKDTENDYSLDWILKDINVVCNFYAQGDVVVSPRGSLRIGKVTMQRKGGTPDPTSLQFKINPLEVFEM